MGSIQRSRSISVDTETNITKQLAERFCLGISVATDEGAYYIPVGHEKWKFFNGSEIVPDNIHVPADFLLHYDGPIIFHNAKFDIQVLEKLGVKVPTGKIYDTMVMSHYINEEKKEAFGGGHALDTLSARHLGKRKEIELAAIMKKDWTKIPPEIMDIYATADAVLTKELYPILDGLMDPAWKELWENYDRRFGLLISEIEVRGIPIDREMCAQLEAQCDFRMREIRKELGFDPAKPSQLHPKLFGEPPVGLGLQIPFHTPTGKPQVPGDWLEHHGHPVCALVYEYRKLGKQKSSYFTAYLNRSTRDYARLHPQFNLIGTETGRMSCENPNLQQIPREAYENAEVKKVFNPEEGKQLWEIDVRGLEYRLAALYANEQRLLALFRNEGDFHQLVADDIGITRFDGKTVNYIMAFGGGVGTLAKKLRKSEKETYKIWKAYKEKYHLIFDKADAATQSCYNNNGEIKMWHGRVRHFNWPSEYRQAWNSLMQGGGFEIVKRMMLRAHDAGAIMSNQVHDSIWVNVDSEKEVIEIQEIMEGWTEKAFKLRFSTDRKLLKAA